MGQVVDLAAVTAASARLRGASQRVVLTNGVFDVLHVGHARYLAAARALGDCLIVGVNDDASVRANKGSGRPIVAAAERAELVAALACVEYVTIFNDQTAERLVRAIQPTIYVKGGDYAPRPGEPGKPLPEAPAVAAVGGRVVIVPLEAGHSSTDLIGRILERHGSAGG